MPASAITDLSRLAVHTQTNRPWTLRQCIDGYQAAGIGAMSVWRHLIDPGQAGGVSPEEAAKLIEGAGMAVPALVRGGFFPAFAENDRQAAIDENRRAIDEAATIGADMIVLVVGAVPGMPLDEARHQVIEGIAAVAPHASERGVKLAIEPLHPMYAADKSCINRVTEARHVCEQVNDPIVGIAFDVYHVWWDPELEHEIQVAGEQGTLFGYHICDWRVNTRHLLTDRGLMGDGCIDLKTIRGWIEATGFKGYNEVEVFSEDYWAMDQSDYVQRIAEAYLQHA